MRELIRLILTLGLVASAATLAGSAIAWWMEEHRRLTRLARKVLGGAPDAVIIAQGRAAAAAFRLAAGQVLVMRDGGARALLYPIDRLLGAELLVDEQIVARVAEGEPRRLLDRVPGGARHVALRLLFDDARHPDFNLDLWLPGDDSRRGAQPAPIMIQEGRAWLGRAEALMRRRTAAAAIAQQPERLVSPVAQVLTETMPVRPAAAPTAAAPIPPAPRAGAEPPPWEDDEAADALDAGLDEEDDGFEAFAEAPEPRPVMTPATPAPAAPKAAESKAKADQLPLF